MKLSAIIAAAFVGISISLSAPQADVAPANDSMASIDVAST
ncbi:hypothetical protein [Ahrensia sp. R2A130]|nr:hypothetical protein [Ahrensia sp. R2A130]EFL89002.1 hypothetical protein R2A130_1489 [Ahrensia sp. R2A130]